jgi:hypothetical protein
MLLLLLVAGANVAKILGPRVRLAVRAGERRA